jgi:amino acid adenylation domain-containing protein
VPTEITPHVAAADPLASETLCDFPYLFRHSLPRWADSLAVQDDSLRLTYTDLDRQSNRIARFLMNAGVAPGDTVGLCVKNSARAITVMLGILKAGGVFVPLDPDYPADRLAFMARDAAIRIIFCEPMFRDRFSDPSPDHASIEDQAWQLIDPLDVRIDSHVDHAPEIEIAADALAYIMYTSGSTGMPKGVQIEHRALAAYCFADIDIYRLTAADRTLQFGTLNFDIAIEEIFPPLLTGGAVIVRPRDRSDDEIELSAIIRDNDITSLHVAAAYWHEWVDLIDAAGQRVPDTLRLVIVTGEKVSPAHYARGLTRLAPDKPAPLWCNAYGPTETTVTATVFIPPQGWTGENMPIGKPLKRYHAYILDPQDRPLGVGETGELYIGGDALARGYLNRPEKNAEAFRHVTFPDGQSRRVYKTGDLARWLDTGDIEFAGRIDHQIKLGSYRIEPQEIEHHLALHPRVRESLVCCDEIDGRKCLTAYIARGDAAISAAELARSVAGSLPDYMIPRRYIFVDAFPKTLNGKIDRRALPSPDQAESSRETPIAPPRSETEQKLAAIFADVLQLDTIGIHDDFFELGGSSLLATRVIAKAHKHFTMPIPVRDFFANPTVALIAALLDRRSSTDRDRTTEDAATRLADHARPGGPSMPTPVPFFFVSSRDHTGRDQTGLGDKSQLFGVHYPPCGTSLRHAVLICPPEGYEYVRAHRNLQQLALILSRTGADVLRFDFTGHGNSGGKVAETGPDHWRGDILDSLRMLRELSQPSRVTVVGLRLGATLAATTRLPDVDHLILIDPVRSGEDYLRMLGELDRRELSGLDRYDRVRQSVIDQRQGCRSSDAKRAEIGRLGFPTEDIAGAKRTLVLTSHRFEDDEGTLRLPATWEKRSCPDEIGWHDHSFTHAAFASANLFRNVIERVTS